MLDTPFYKSGHRRIGKRVSFGKTSSTLLVGLILFSGELWEEKYLIYPLLQSSVKCDIVKSLYLNRFFSVHYQHPEIGFFGANLCLQLRIIAQYEILLVVAASDILLASIMASSSSSSVDVATAADTITTSIAILIGANNNASKSVSVVVWICHERARQSMQDPWKYTLEYFQFLDDTARWTHLDQLLLRYPPLSLHVASAESTSPQRDRLMENLQVFLEEHHAGQDNTQTACHLHNQVTMETTKMESAVSHLLLQDTDVQLAYRGNLELSQSKLLQHGLALWLQAEELYPPTADHWSHSIKVQAGMLNSHLVMDRTAAACIHLLPPANAGVATVVGGQSHNNSLFGMLSQPCATPMGKAKLQVWLRQPLIDPCAILYRQDAVTTLLQGMGKDSLKEALQGFSGVDLPKLATILALYESEPVTNTKKPLKALYQLYLLSSTQLPQLIEVMESFEQSSSQLLQNSHSQLTQLLAELDRCQGLVEAVMDLDSAPREYLVKPSFSSDLQDLYQELQQVRSQADDELLNMQDIWSQASGDDKTQVRLESCTVNNSDSTSTSSWQFRLPNTNAAKIVESLPANHGMKLHRVLKNGVYFSTKQLRALSASYQQVSTEYSNHSLQVVQDAMQVATTYQTVVERAAQVVSTLDVVMALARVAAYSPHGYCKPILTDSDDGGIEVRFISYVATRVESIEILIAHSLPLAQSSSSSLCRIARRYRIHSQ